MPDPIALAQSGKSGSGGSSPAVKREHTDRAVLKLYKPTPAGEGGGSPGDDIGSIDFQFNPKEVSIQKSAKWERKQSKGAKKAGPVEFTGADPCKLTMEMFFDATGQPQGSVVAAVESLFACCVPTQESADKDKPSPPLVVLHWGSISSFPAYVKSVSAKYTLFNTKGIPIRAVCSVSLEEMPDEPWRQNPTSGGEAVQKAHTMIDGDTLASVAYAEYGQAPMWRQLARYNRIDDPLRCRAGTTLLLPSPEQLR